MGFGRMQSNAEMRSVATKSRFSPRSKISRTLPLATLRMPGSSSVRMSMSDDDWRGGRAVSSARRESLSRHFLFHTYVARADDHWHAHSRFRITAFAGREARVFEEPRF